MSASSSAIEIAMATPQKRKVAGAHTPRRFRRILDLEDFERVVRRRLPRAVYGYVAHGAETETTLRGNRAAFDQWRLVPRVLVGVEQRSSRITLFGREYEQPFGIAPMGGSALVAYEGHNAMAAAAAQAHIPFILSANSIIPMEEVAKVNRHAWFAAYQSPTRDAIEGMVERVARAGFEALVVTADVPKGSNREFDARAGFGFPIRPHPRLVVDVVTHPRWVVGTLARTFLKRGIPDIVNLEPDGGPNLFSTKVKSIAAHESLNWEHIRVMRSLWKRPLIVKGVLSPADVARAREVGLDGVILSNHGGRQLDHAISPMDALEPAIIAAGDMTVMIDSGFRRGTDVVKALALGARAVFIGRPFLFATAFAGRAGVAHAISLLGKEIDTDLALLGCHDIAELRPKLLAPTGGARYGVAGAAE